jgi:hypothetical protein
MTPRPEQVNATALAYPSGLPEIVEPVGCLYECLFPQAVNGGTHVERSK